MNLSYTRIITNLVFFVNLKYVYRTILIFVAISGTFLARSRLKKTTTCFYVILTIYIYIYKIYKILFTKKCFYLVTIMVFVAQVTCNHSWVTHLTYISHIGQQVLYSSLNTESPFFGKYRKSPFGRQSLFGSYSVICISGHRADTE